MKTTSMHFFKLTQKCGKLFVKINKQTACGWDFSTSLQVIDKLRVDLANTVHKYTLNKLRNNITYLNLYIYSFDVENKITSKRNFHFLISFTNFIL